MRLDQVAVFGGGTTGGGLAKALALAGVTVAVIERNRASAEESRDRLVMAMDREIAKYGLTESEKRAVLARITFSSSARDAAAADLFVEAVPELVTVKRRVLREMEAVEDAELRRVKLTNSAALPISDLQEGLAAPQLLIGFHVLPPSDSVPLVELVRGQSTSDDTVTTAHALARRLQKRAVAVVEYPGLITTRILVPLLNEAIHAAMEGVASPQEIDDAMKATTGMDRGPLSMADHFGLDEVLHWMETLHRELGDAKYLPCPLLRRMVRRGHLGEKSGQGFYEYSNGAP